MFSSGDTGSRNPLSYFVNADASAEPCSQYMPSYPASSPYVTAVGATQLKLTQGKVKQSFVGRALCLLGPQAHFVVQCGAQRTPSSRSCAPLRRAPS